MVFLENLKRELEKRESPRKEISKPKIERGEIENLEKEFNEVKIIKPKVFFSLNTILNKLLVLSSVVFFIAIITFLIINFRKQEPVKELKVSLIGPQEVNSLEENLYTLSIDNYSSEYLTNVNLSIFLSEGAYFKGEEIKEKNFSLGEIKPNSSTKIFINLNFINEGNKDEEVRTVLRYKIRNKPYLFETESKHLILVKNPPLLIIPQIPAKVFVLQTFQADFKIINNSKEEISNLRIKINLPKDFDLSFSFPPLNNSENEWLIGSLKPNQSFTISLFGKFNSLSLYPLFYPSMSFTWQNQNFVLGQKSYKVTLLENPISLELKTYPSGKSFYPGSHLSYKLIITNKSKISLRENIIKITFNELFNPSTIRAQNGYYSTLDKAIYFNSRYEPKLLEIKPNETVELNFGASLFSNYQILGEKNKDFNAKVFVEFKTPSIPPEVRDNFSDEYSLKFEDEKRIIGKYEIRSFLVYKDKFFDNRGPLPLLSEQPTTLSWYIKIKTIGEDFENFSLTGKLPPYVNFTGQIGGDASLGNFNFDSRTGEYSYFLKSIPANTGYQTKELELVFQIIVLPPAGISTYLLEILPSPTYQITSSFTKISFSGNLDSISSSEIISELK